MQITTTGIVLKEVKTGEADRILTILTQELGIISASAKNSLRIKSKLVSSTALFSYSEFTLFPGKTMYSINSADSINIFHGINDSIEGLSLAMYLTELTAWLVPAQQPAGDQLPLVLNCLYCISKQKYSHKLIKAVYELRTLSNIGFMPNLVACNDCVKYDGGDFYFDYTNSIIFCSDCAQKRSQHTNLSASVLAAMRHIVFSEAKKIFSFSLNDQSIDLLFKLIQQYTLGHIGRPLKTLDFLQTILD